MLVIGTVVDDAIVVVEAVQAKLDGGCRSSYEATVSAMGEITSAVITTTIVFMAVFIPTSFLGGTSGTFYMQFGLTMGRGGGHLHHQCPDALSGALRPADEAGDGRQGFRGAASTLPSTLPSPV